MQAISPPLTSSIDALRPPLVVWIDDNPVNNRGLVVFAENKGINVISIKSTAEAKEWINTNHGKRLSFFLYRATLMGFKIVHSHNHQGFLIANNTASRIRFISDNCRRENTATGQQYANTNAGEDLLIFIRGRRYHDIPVLVYCGNTTYTRYVTRFKDAVKFTTSFGVVKDYICALAEGKDDDVEWKEVGW